MSKHTIRYSPSKRHIKKIVKEHMAVKDCKQFLKNKGIIAIGMDRNYLANTMASFYFDRNSYIDFKNLIDCKHNLKKSASVHFSKDNYEEVVSSLDLINNKIIDEKDDTKISLHIDEDENVSFSINYIESNPSKIDLLDETPRQIDVRIIDSPDGNKSFDFNHSSISEYRKALKVFDKIKEQNTNFNFDFSQISLGQLDFEGKISLFDNFFNHDHCPWELEEIVQLKIKKFASEDNSTSSTNVVTNTNLRGINSALLDGDDLRENPFVKDVIQQGYYFSMAEIRFSHVDEPISMHLVIDFKTTNENFEVSFKQFTNTEYDEHNELKETKYTMDVNEQETWLKEFKDVIFNIYKEILDSPCNDSIDLSSDFTVLDSVK